MDNDIFKQERYEPPKEEFIEFSPEEDGTVKTTEIKETEEKAPDLLTAPKMEILRYAAKKAMNIDLVDPDEACSKCYGRGYVGIESRTFMPVACKCVFPNSVNLKRIEKQKARLARKESGKNV